MSTRVRGRAAKPSPNIENDLVTALKALAELYPSDKTSPGLVLSWLPERKLFYASFVRYEDQVVTPGVPPTRRVIANVIAATFPEAISSVIANWRAGTLSAHRMLRRANKIQTISSPDFVGSFGNVY